MEISKVIGTIEERIKNEKSDHAILKIHGYKKNGIYYYNDIEINEEFGSKKKIFSPGFFGRYSNILIGDLVEIEVKNIEFPDSASRDLIILDKTCKPFGYKAFNFNPNAFLNSKSIDTTQLIEPISSINFDFYVFNETYIYGLFKNENNSVLPKTGTEVSKYKKDNIKLIESHSNYFILNKPEQANKICEIDCKTSDQIIKWFKERISVLKLTLDFDEIRIKLREVDLHELDLARFDKVKKYLEQINLNYSEILKLSRIEEFKSKVEQSIIECKDEIRKELEREILDHVQTERISIQSDISSLKREKEIIIKENKEFHKQLKPLKEELDKLNGEYEFLKTEKDRLIYDIKLHSSIKTENYNTIKSKLITFEIQDYSKTLEPFLTLNHYIDTFSQTINNDEAKRIAKSIYQLKEYKCLLSNRIHLILKIADTSNNCKVFIQQVEPDWLKFNKFYNKVFKSVLESAQDETTKIHFLILEDLNLSSPECYARPVFDYLVGNRKKLPGINSPWPENLWVFGIPIDEDEDDKIGLPLRRSIFEKWGALPRLTSDISFSNVTSNNLLLLDILKGHDKIPTTCFNEYFEI